jgi:hypothetical protein
MVHLFYGKTIGSTYRPCHRAIGNSKKLVGSYKIIYGMVQLFDGKTIGAPYRPCQK